MITYICEVCKKPCEGYPVNGTSGFSPITLQSEKGIVFRIQTDWVRSDLSLTDFEAKEKTGPHLCKKCFQKLVPKVVSNWKTIQVTEIGKK